MTVRDLKACVTLGALGVLLIRIVWPELRIDAVSLGLLAMAVLPWLSPLIKSAELPGGFKIEFQEIKEAGDKIIGKAFVLNAEPGSYKVTGFAPAVRISPADPNLQLVAVRIEVEKRLRALAEKAQLPIEQSVVDVARSLRMAGVLESSELAGLTTLIEAGNKAAHGAKVAPAIEEWAQNTAGRVLDVLDAKMKTS